MNFRIKKPDKDRGVPFSQKSTNSYTTHQNTNTNPSRGIYFLNRFSKVMFFCGFKNNAPLTMINKGTPIRETIWQKAIKCQLRVGYPCTQKTAAACRKITKKAEMTRKRSKYAIRSFSPEYRILFSILNLFKTGAPNFIHAHSRCHPTYYMTSIYITKQMSNQNIQAV